MTEKFTLQNMNGVTRNKEKTFSLNNMNGFTKKDEQDSSVRIDVYRVDEKKKQLKK